MPEIATPDREPGDPSGRLPPGGAGRLGRYSDLCGRVVVVTGGSRGIGAATAAAFASNGASVVVVGRDEDALASVVDEIDHDGGTAMWVRADCTVESDLGDLARTVDDRLGAAHVVVAFAGGNGMPVPTVEESPAHWREIVETDLTSVFLTVHAFLPAMLAHKMGNVITMSSAAARQPAHSAAAYATAKAGVVAFTRHLANEVAPEGIRVNCIAPSAIENAKMRRWMTEEQRRNLVAAFPLRRIGQPDDVAAAALFLGSDSSSWITGATLDIAGGKIMV